METIVGPVLARSGGYAFDTWEAELGFRPGFVYRRIEDARYARNVQIQSGRGAAGFAPIVCSTLDEFIGETRDRRPLNRAA